MDRNITQNFSGDTARLNGQSLFKLLYDGIFFLSSCTLSYICGGLRGRDRMAVLPVQSVRIPNGEVYSIQQYMIKFVSDLRQVGDFLRFPPPIKVTTTI